MRRRVHGGSTDDRPRKRVPAHKKDCGCTTGAIFMAVALLASLGWILTDRRLDWLQVLARLPLVAVLALLAAGVGKAGGMLYVRHRHHRRVAQLTREGAHHGGNVG